MNQYVYFNQEGVSITLNQLSVNNQYYPLKNIISIRLAKIRTGRRLAVLVMVLSLFVLLTEGDWFVYGGLLFFVGVLIWISFEGGHGLMITTSEGEKSVLVNKDKEYIEKIIQALDTAMTESRQGEN